MRGGSLDRIITIRRDNPSGSPAKNEYGEAVENWQDYLTNLPAAYTPNRAGTRIVAAQYVEETEAVFKIRWRADIRATDRVVFEGTTYEILGQPLEIGRREGLNLNVRSIAISDDTGTCPVPPSGS